MQINCEFRYLKLVRTSSKIRVFAIEPLSIPVVFKHASSTSIPGRRLPIYRLNPEVPVDAFYSRDKVERGEYPRENYLILMTVEHFTKLLRLVDELLELKEVLDRLLDIVTKLDVGEKLRRVESM